MSSPKKAILAVLAGTIGEDRAADAIGAYVDAKARLLYRPNTVVTSVPVLVGTEHDE